MGLFIARIQESFNKKVSSKGVGLFRIAFSLVLLCELLQMHYFRHLIFDPLPYLQPSDLDFGILLNAWIIAVVFLLIGWMTRTAAIINFILSTFIFTSLTEFEYHIFYTYQAISFLLVFIPTSRSFSVDRIIEKLKYSGPFQTYEPPQKVNVWAYYLPVLLGMAFVYFDSVFFKLTSKLIWLKGLGMWLPASIPQAVHMNLSWLLNQEYLVKFFGILTIFFEAMFIFLFWFKRFRIPLLIIGIGLHVGIFLAFPIPWFALGVIGLYLLLIPVKFWERFAVAKKEKVAFYYDAECPLCVRTKIILQSITPTGRIGFYSVQSYAHKSNLLSKIDLNELYKDIHGIKNNKIYKGVELYREVFCSIWYLVPLGILLFIPGISHAGKWLYRKIADNRNTERCTEETCGYTPPQLPLSQTDNIKIFKNITIGSLKNQVIKIFVVICFFFQFLVTWNSPLMQNSLTILPKKLSFLIDTPIKLIGEKLKPVYYTLFCFTSHPVFMDGHFKNYNHIVALKNKQGNFLPIINDKGMVSKYAYGCNWVNFTFRVNSPKVRQSAVINGLERYLLFYLMKNNINYKNYSCDFMVKKIDIPEKWEYNFLNNMIARPWQRVGEMGWKNGEFFCNIPEIEQL